MVFGMAWRFAAELPEPADFIERDGWLPDGFVIGIHRLDAGQVKNRPEQHRGMAIGKHKPVAVWPNRVLRVIAHSPVPNRIDERRERHGCARMGGLGNLNGIYRKRADCINRKLCHFLLLYNSSFLI